MGRPVSPLHRVVVGGALGAAYGVDAAVHHGHSDPVSGGVERRSLAPLVGHGVVAAEGAGLRVGAAAGLERQVPASNLDSPNGEEKGERGGGEGGERGGGEEGRGLEERLARSPKLVKTNLSPFRSDGQMVTSGKMISVGRFWL